ncbi:FadR/GntR family transcriptional regulator [Brevibacterium yomogidense]|uniref:FadR/GntR family transcriptional regulator n=1 Tax=Brevibacterium yomogidense TaxID=946573 RepID=UPI0018DF2ACA|nr:FCD domain-containing protein [Brevibacterium yomogidense]
MSTSLTTQVASALRAEIASGTLRPGDRLPSEGMLIERFGVSRTVVREAIGRLRAEGLVRTQRGSGSFALTPPGHHADAQRPAFPTDTAEQRTQLLEFRIALESEAAALAAARCSSSALDDMRQALTDFTAAAHVPAAALEADFAFHRAVAAASGNAHIAHALAELGPSMIVMPAHRLAAHPAGGPSDHIAEVEAEHSSVLRAIAAGDPLAAAACMRAHLSNSLARTHRA